MTTKRSQIVESFIAKQKNRKKQNKKVTHFLQKHYKSLICLDKKITNQD